MTRATVGERILAGLTAIACLAVLGLAAWLKPATSGFGTHEQLAMRPCTWVLLFDRPCPTCGMTTAFAHAARFDLVSSARAQPAGAILALGAAVGVWVAGHTALTGSGAVRLCLRRAGTRTLFVTLGVLGAAWGYKLATWPGA